MKRCSLLCGAAFVGAACGGGADSGGTAPPKPTPVASITVVLSATTLIQGSTTTASAVPKDAVGNTLTGRTVTWASSVAAVASVDASGLVIGVSPGTAAITATSEGITGSAVIVVAPPPVAAIVVTLSAGTLEVGGTGTATAVVKDAAGNSLAGRPVAWSSSAPTVVSVDGSGVVRGVTAGTATITATSEGVSGSKPIAITAFTGIATGIKNIASFLEVCPTADPAYAQIRQDFELRIDGQLIATPIMCSGSISDLPIDQFTDELIAVQVLRTAYYMSQGTDGRLPWTTKSLYAWMLSNIAGVNLKTAPGQLYCCDVINGKRYFSTSRQDATQRAFKRTWMGISGSVNFFAHEIRHADAGAPGHTTGCPAFPLSTDPAGCDATYDISNLGSYGVQYWLESQWATGRINIGIGCLTTTAQANAKWDESSANSFRARFVTNPPPVVTASPPYGGPCLP